MLYHPKLKSKSRHSFTLIELLAVIAIIGLLAAMGIAALSNALAKSRDTRREGDFRSFPNALELYYQDQGHYPIWTPGGCTTDGQSNPLISALVPTYMLILPKDPLLTRYCLFYQSDSTGLNYKLAAKMERDTTRAASDGGTASNYYEAYNASGSTISLTNSDLDKVMLNQQTYGEASVVAEWKMDENSWNNNCSASTVLDSSAYANHGKSCPNGTGPLGGETSCMSGKCGLFDGGDDYVDCGDPTNGSLDLGTHDFSFDVWIKASSVPTTYQIVFSKEESSAKRWILFVDKDHAFKIALYLNGWWKYGSTPLNDNEWHFIAVSADRDDKTKIYVDNVLEINETSFTENLDNIGSFRIGIEMTTYPFKGLIDEVRIYSRALSACEVCEQCRRFQSKASCNNCTNCSGN